jgi:hypothetical protein
MKVPMLIEPIEGDRFRATVAAPLPLTAEGNTRLEAIRKLEEMLRQRLAAGAELLPLEVPVNENPLAPFIGMWKPDDPLFQEWQQAIEEYRKQVDEDASVP